MPEYCLYHLFCLAVLLACAVPVAQPQQNPQSLASNGLPSYKLTFVVYYNTSSTPRMSQQCGEYYAETFLSNFLPAQDQLQAYCRRPPPGQGSASPGLGVKVITLARVRIHGSRVEVETYLDVSVNRRRGGNRDDMVRCEGIIKEILHDPVRFEHQISGDVQTIREIPANADKECSRAVMSPQFFTSHGAIWVCPENSTFMEDLWRCSVVSREELDTSTSEAPAVTVPSSVTSQSGITSVDVSETYRTSQYTSVTISDNVGEAGVVSTSFPLSPTVSSQPVDSGTASSSMETDAASTTPPPFGDWGIKLGRLVTSQQLVEGEPSTDIDIKVWANQSALCAGGTSCRITVDVSFFDGVHPKPICRRSGQSMPQVVVGRPLWAATEPASGPSSYCSVLLRPDHANGTEVKITLVLKAVSDNKYDGLQRRYMDLSLNRVMEVGRQTQLKRETVYKIPIEVQDKDRKATCQSINDPHITTFDGLQYNNYYEGEFVLYRHRSLPFKVHAIYQRCSPSSSASCNCAVAIQSGDDVIVIDRCFRKKQALKRIEGVAKDIPPMAVQIFLNGELTPATKIFQEADGRKYFIYLPHGAYIKVMISEMLLNAWIVATPGDISQTEGLCGTYDWNWRNDLTASNGTTYDTPTSSSVRSQPRSFILSWRVDTEQESLFGGAPKANTPYVPAQYCECEQDQTPGRCGYAVDVNNCDVLQGSDVTETLVARAVKSTWRTKRRRDVSDNVISVIPEDPIVIDKQFVPKKHEWDANSNWNEASAKHYCRNHIKDKYPIGKLCSNEVPSVDFQQEITTCVEDIQTIDNISWSDSARDAMKEQCLEEVQKNGSLPEDIANRIQGSICVNDCSDHGQCINGSCHCQAGYMLADCSITDVMPPYAGEIPRYGLCDTRYMNCSRVIVYGAHFVHDKGLTCHFQECEINDEEYVPKEKTITRPAVFINFNAVECAVPSVRAYLISVSNNGINTSDPLLFIPFDSVCNRCNAFNTSCVKKRNSCIIDGHCYMEGESSSVNECLQCKPHADELEWTTLDEIKCQQPWWNTFKLPDWAVAVPAAIGGTVVGILVGFLLYKCCCKNRKEHEAEDMHMGPRDNTDPSPFEDAMLHRNRGLPAFSSDRFSDINLPQQAPEQYQESYFYNDGRGVENGVDSTTYF